MWKKRGTYARNGGGATLAHPCLVNIDRPDGPDLPG